MNEKEIIKEMPKEISEEELMREAAATAGEISPYALPQVKIEAFISDGNNLLDVDDYNAQANAVNEIKKAIKAERICFGEVYGTEPREVRGIKVLLKFDGVLRVVIPDFDFFKHSDMKDIESATDEELAVRYQRKAVHYLDAKVSFVPITIQEDEYGVPYVIASRRKAMEQNQRRFFFGRRVPAIHTHTNASIVSSGPRYIVVEALGVETTIGVGALSAFEYIDDASKIDKFKVGNALPVLIEAINVDPVAHKVDVKFSHALYEAATTKIKPIDESLIGGRYKAIVLGITNGHYVVMINALKHRGLVAFEDFVGDRQLFNKDEIVLLVTKIDKKRNLVYGRCLRKENN